MFWLGIGIGLMVGTVLVALGAANQYRKGREDGFEAGRIAGYDIGFEEGFDHINDYQSPLVWEEVLTNDNMPDMSKPSH